MPEKLSKSDTLDREREARDKEFLNRSSPSLHFSVGTGVVLAGRRGEILAQYTVRHHVSHPETWLLVRWSDGRMGTIKPVALN